MRNSKRLTTEQKEKIVALSRTHYPKEIAKAVGCTHMTVMRIQQINGIINPLRKHIKTKRRVQDFSSNGYFNIEAWAKEMAF